MATSYRFDPGRRHYSVGGSIVARKILNLNSDYVFSISTTRRDIAAKLEETTRQLVKHLIKLYLYPDYKDVQHWRQEVYSFLHSISKIKGRNKLPSSRFILANTIQSNLELIAVWYYNILDDYGTPSNSKCSETELTRKVSNYYRWLADILSAQGEVSRKSIYNKLSELGFGDD